MRFYLLLLIGLALGRTTKSAPTSERKQRWENIVHGIQEQDFFTVLSMDKGTWEVGAFGSSTKEYDGDQVLGHISESQTISVDAGHENERQFIAFLEQTYPKVFPDELLAFRNWSAQVFDEHALRHPKHKFLHSNKEYRALLLGVRATFVLANTKPGVVTFRLNGLAGLDPSESTAFRGLSIPDDVLEVSTFKKKSALRRREKKKKLTDPPTDTTTPAPSTSPLSSPTAFATKSSGQFPYPSGFDLRDYSAISPIKNQGNCGCCYAFAATSVTEGMSVMSAGMTLISLSEQYPVSCGNIGGCVAGWMPDVWDFTANGEVSEQTYPFESGSSVDGSTLPCISSEITSFVVETAANEVSYVTDQSDMQSAILNGPIAIAISGGNSCFEYYHSGLLTCDCPSDVAAIDHAVTVIGWGDGYWIIRNSWGVYWGEEGYAQFPFESPPGPCGMYNFAMFPNTVKAYP
jgi:C1A family cysteine protease